jgi:hypothetical protein
MHLTVEELLKIIHSDCSPDELGHLLDRLERCPESARALEVLVVLRAHRLEALEALRLETIPTEDRQSAPTLEEE